jgi:hypothetical protein
VGVFEMTIHAYQNDIDAAFAAGAASRDGEIEAVRRANLDCMEHFSALKADYDALRTELQALREQEPVAWQYDWYTDDGEGNSVVMTDWITSDHDEAHSPTMGCHNIRPLYLAAKPATVEPSQTRLTALYDIAVMATVGATYPELMEYLQSEIAFAEEAKDAARYRWLKSKANIELHSDGSTWVKNGVNFVASHRLCTGSTAHGHYATLDETIDSAMEAETRK